MVTSVRWLLGLGGNSNSASCDIAHRIYYLKYLCHRRSVRRSPFSLYSTIEKREETGPKTHKNIKAKYNRRKKKNIKSILLWGCMQSKRRRVLQIHTACCRCQPSSCRRHPTRRVAALTIPNATKM